MKKYIVKYKDGGKVYGEYSSRKEASDKLMEHIHNFNKYFEGEYLSPFDFVLEVVECREVNEVITDFDSAIKYLVGNTNDDFIVGKECFSKRIYPQKDAEILIKELNPKHIEALIALNRLSTISEAWNKAEGFVPDFSDTEQDKWFPWFEYDEDVAGFVYAYTLNSHASERANICSRLCFKTRERAEQFGKQFIELYNKVFL